MHIRRPLLEGETCKWLRILRQKYTIAELAVVVYSRVMYSCSFVASVLKRLSVSSNPLWQYSWA